MKRLFACCLLLVATGSWLLAQQTLHIRLSGNAYVTSGPDGARIGKDGLENWTSPESVVSTYFYLHVPQTFSLSMKAKGHSTVVVNAGGSSFTVEIDSDDFAVIPVGDVVVSSPGYVRVDLRGLDKSGAVFGWVEEIIAANVTGEYNYVYDFSDYWGRRGPSVHMGYTLPEGDTEWFYNEIMVPKEGEVMHSYYMAAGFDEGYFGMQTNSSTERRILFSVWSPYDTQNPNDIPEEYRIRMLRRGEGVHIGEFGNEGSGGQSYLRYMWKADVVYKFLMQVRPDGKGNTVYTAYFFATDEDRWRLIASFLRPKTDTWYKRPHSFLENFSPQQGYLARKVLYTNQWSRSRTGTWTRLTTGRFTHDATAKAGVRLDFQGGVEGDFFYLKMGGFFNESVPMGTIFERTAVGNQPVIDFDALEKLE